MSPPASTPAPFFPPPLRLSRATQGSASRKRPRFCFTSDLTYGRDYVFPRYNPDGSENVDWMRMQSMIALKAKWDGICDKFKDAHMLPQDEIYLGRGADGIQLLKDRGHLRAIRKAVPFGYFIAQNEQQEAQQARDRDDLDAWAGEMPIPPPPSDVDQRPDLEEFLKAERRRKALLGLDSDEEEEDEDGVVDFTDPNWSDAVEVEDEQDRLLPGAAKEHDPPRGANDLDPPEDLQCPLVLSPQGQDDDDPLRLSTPPADPETESEGDELDVLPDTSAIPDLSSIGLSMLESLIRKENARLAPQGYMLAEEDEVHDLAVALASGSHRSASVVSDLSIREPASDSTLVDASPWSARSESTCLASSPAPSLLSPPPRSSPTFFQKGNDRLMLPPPAPTPSAQRTIGTDRGEELSLAASLQGPSALPPTPGSRRTPHSTHPTPVNPTTTRLSSPAPTLAAAPAKAPRRSSTSRSKRKRSSIRMESPELIAPPAGCGGPGVCHKTFCFSCGKH